MSKLFVLKVPTDLNKDFYLVAVNDDEYTLCKESESMYDGSYPLCSNIVCYYSEEEKREVVVPYKNGTSDRQYGFHEFISILDLLSYIGMYSEIMGMFSLKYPEYLI